jgi:hypothetical protein
MPDYTSLGSFTATTPNMDTFDIPAFDRLAGRYYFSIVWIRSRKIRDPLHVVGNRVV